VEAGPLASRTTFHDLAPPVKVSLRPYSRFLEAILAVFLLGIVAGEVVLFSPPVQTHVQTLATTAQIERVNSDSTTLEVKITHGTADENLRLVAFPRPPAGLGYRTVFVYYDGAYPTASVNPLASQGVIDNLAGELLIRHYPRSVFPMSAATLVDILRRTTDASSEAIVAMTGVMPSNTFSRGVDLLTPWVRAGGLLIWGGATIGYYSGVEGRSLATIPAKNGPSLGESGIEQILGKGIVAYPWASQRVATNRSDAASAFGLTYQFASAGIKSGAALARGGKVLGWYTDQYSSVTFLPVARGGYLIFGGEVLDAALISRDIAQLLASGVQYGSGQIAARDIRLSDLRETAVVRWPLPFGASTSGVTFIAFDPRPDGAFFYQREIDV